MNQPKVAPGSSSAASSSVKPPSTPTPAPAQTPAPPPAPVAAQSTSSSNVPSTPSPAPAASGGATTEGGNFNDPSALALGSERAAAISNMESMGFPRTEIDRAMRAAFNNPDRAGIPESFQQEEQAARQAPRRAGGASGAAAVPQTDAPTPGSTEATGDGGDEPINLFEAAAQAGRSGSGGRGAGRQGTGNVPGLEGLTAPGAGAGAGAGGLGNLDFLRNNPQFQQLRQIVQTQPRMLEPILQQVGAGNPQLAQLIGQNPDQFLQLLSEDADEDAPLPPGAQAVSVTEEEREAIERASFDRDLAIQAYFACDKNEELAANFLFEQPPEEGED
ncbi:hypothetical protein MMC14_007877 [Varicellaria rhodocarpa]|nr:hypothetical protein [Varicellaria rhodocarpa]